MGTVAELLVKLNAHQGATAPYTNDIVAEVLLDDVAGSG